MSGTIHTFFGRAILPISVSIAVADLAARSPCSASKPGLSETYISTDPAADVVDHRDRGRLGDLRHGERGRLDLLGAQPVPGHVDHVVDPAEDPEVAVGGLHRAVAGEVRPVAPVLAVRVLVVLRVVGVDEPLGLAPDRLEDARPRVADADVARLAAAASGPRRRPRRRSPGRCRARPGRSCPASSAAAPGRVLPRKPPFSVCHQVSMMTASPLPTVVVVPAPDLGLDRLAHRRHVLEVVVVLAPARPGRPCAASGSRSARCGRCSRRAARRSARAARRRDRSGTPS